MNKRARLDRNGPAIAKAGYDIDTATLAQMAFIPSFAAWRLRETGITTATTYSGGFSAYYRRAAVTLSPAYERPPLAFMVIRISETETIQAVGYNQSGGTLPRMMVMSYTDRVEFYIRDLSSTPTYILKYFIFENTLED